jgi:hypothetical protein
LHSAATQTAAEPVDLDQYRVRRQTRAGGTISEYRCCVTRTRSSARIRKITREVLLAAAGDH